MSGVQTGRRLKSGGGEKRPSRGCDGAGLPATDDNEPVSGVAIAAGAAAGRLPKRWAVAARCGVRLLPLGDVLMRLLTAIVELLLGVLADGVRLVSVAVFASMTFWCESS